MSYIFHFVFLPGNFLYLLGGLLDRSHSVSFFTGTVMLLPLLWSTCWWIICLYMMTNLNHYLQGWCEWGAVLSSSIVWARCYSEGGIIFCFVLYICEYSASIIADLLVFPLLFHQACASLEPNYQPPVTFVVVQKRHHTRLFASNHHDKGSVDRSGNILPGIHS